MSDWPDVTDWRAWTETLTPAIFDELFGQKLLRKLPIYRPVGTASGGAGLHASGDSFELRGGLHLAPNGHNPAARRALLTGCPAAGL
jgi:hypothetical protein